MKLLFVSLLTLALAIAKPNPKHFLVETEDKNENGKPEDGNGNGIEENRGRYPVVVPLVLKGLDKFDPAEKEYLPSDSDEVPEPAEKSGTNRQWDMWNFGLGK